MTIGIFADCNENCILINLNNILLNYIQSQTSPQELDGVHRRFISVVQAGGAFVVFHANNIIIVLVSSHRLGSVRYGLVGRQIGRRVINGSLPRWLAGWPTGQLVWRAAAAVESS